MLTELKKQEDFTFLKDVDSIALQQSLRDLDRGFKNFFEKRARHPQFKSKHNNHQSYRTINQGDNIRIVGKYIKLPKLGYVKIRQSMEVGHINNVTIERTPTGKYFDKEKCIVKITPIHETVEAVNNSYEIVKDFDVYEKFEKPLVEDGWDVIVFVPSREEDSDRITCGNALISEKEQ